NSEFHGTIRAGGGALVYTSEAKGQLVSLERRLELETGRFEVEGELDCAEEPFLGLEVEHEKGARTYLDVALGHETLQVSMAPPRARAPEGRRTGGQVGGPRRGVGSLER